jgi:zinc-ribbon domain
MICSQCGNDVAAGSAACPNCGAQLAGNVSQPAQAPAGAPAGGAAPAAAGQTFSFDLQRLSRNDQIVGAGTLVLFISLFLPWFSGSVGIYSNSVNGLYHGYMYITLIVALVILAYLVLRAGFAQLPFNLPFRHEQLLLVGTGINFLLTIISFVFKPASVPGVSIGWSIGAFLGLIAAAVAVVPEGLPFVRSRIGR